MPDAGQKRQGRRRNRGHVCRAGRVAERLAGVAVAAVVFCSFAAMSQQMPTRPATDKEVKRVEASPVGQALRTGNSEHDRWDRAIVVAALRHQIPAALIKAVIKRESYFKPRVVSRAGAIGLMQLMPETAKRLGVNPYEAEQNIDGGTRYLSELAHLFKGDLIAMLASYNAGEHRVFAHGYVPPYRETRNYVVRVLTAYVEFGGQLDVKPSEMFRKRLEELKKEEEDR